MSSAAKAMTLARMMSAWLWPVSFAALLVLIVVVQQFVRNRRSQYPLVLLAVYVGIARVLVVRHVMPLQMSWEPDVGTWTVWGLYYLAYGPLVALATWRLWDLWLGNSRLGRLLQATTLCFMVYHGFLTIVKPYWLILKT